MGQTTHGFPPAHGQPPASQPPGSKLGPCSYASSTRTRRYPENRSLPPRVFLELPQRTHMHVSSLPTHPPTTTHVLTCTHHSRPFRLGAAYCTIAKHPATSTTHANRCLLISNEQPQRIRVAWMRHCVSPPGPRTARSAAKAVRYRPCSYRPAIAAAESAQPLGGVLSTTAAARARS